MSLFFYRLIGAAMLDAGMYCGLAAGLSLVMAILIGLLFGPTVS